MAKRKQRKKKKKHIFNESVYNKIEGWIGLASHKLREEKYDEAIRLYEKVVTHRKATRKQRAEGYAQIATVFAQNKQFPRAFNNFTKAIEYMPRPHWGLFYNRAKCAVHTTRLGLALEDIERAAELCNEPEWVEEVEETRQLIVDVIRQECEVRGEHFTVDDLLEQQAHFRKGIDAIDAGDLDSAESAFKDAMTMGDVMSQSRYNLGVVYAQQEEWDKAEAMWKATLELDPDHEYARQNLDRIPPLKGNLKESPTLHFVE